LPDLVDERTEAQATEQDARPNDSRLIRDDHEE